MTITDAAFVHLHGIHTLYMKVCNQITIADAGFFNLRVFILLKPNAAACSSDRCRRSPRLGPAVIVEAFVIVKLFIYD